MKPAALPFDPARRTGLGNLGSAKKNLYCRLSDLSNEASVEQFFVNRMIDDLGYKDSQVKPKNSLSALTVAKGRRREKYKPDLALFSGRLPRCIIDAKAVTEDLDEWVEQGSGYCLALNRKYQKSNPVRYFVLSNGITTVCYEWDNDEPLLTLSFSDFMRQNYKYKHLRSLLSSTNIANSLPSALPEQRLDFRFSRPTTSRARQLFQQCHKTIWKSEGYGPAPAFLAFVKLMFVKLWADQNLRQDSTISHLLSDGTDFKLPKSAITFSLNWIEQRKKEGASNPVNDIFVRLRDEIERGIVLSNKKRIFSKEEDLGLRADTVAQVVEKLQHYDMFGIDEDLNGRLFETFLAATMRGRELGQFFTPRSVVKMMTQLADLRVTRDHQDHVLDGCCGTGGFLIESLAVLRNVIRANESLSTAEKNALIETVANGCVHGIDFGQDPPLARVARINMFLHGDGGSSIYYADALDKEVDNSTQRDDEVVQNLVELKGNLKNTRFDVVLTNPPFSMTKEGKNPSEFRVLRLYDLAYVPNTRKVRSSLRSSIMFMERYHDLLKPGGKLLTVIDETLLSSKDFSFVRDFIRQRFLIRAIISLPGDTFRRSGSRVKTSTLFLEKKRAPDERQGNWFHYFSEFLGVDDLPSKASDREVEKARARSLAETEKIFSEYRRYLRGEVTEHVLEPEFLSDRLDLRNCVPLIGRRVPAWEAAGIQVERLEDVVTPIDETIRPRDDAGKKFKMLKVTYEGQCVIESEKLGVEIVPNEMRVALAGQIIFSLIRATDGSIGIVPKDLSGGLVSKSSFMVFDCESEQDAAYLWSVLRSYEVRADMQSMSPGSTRYQTPWDYVRNLKIPWMTQARRKDIGNGILKVWEMERELKQRKQESLRHVVELEIESDDSRRRWEVSKAPK